MSSPPPPAAAAAAPPEEDEDFDPEFDLCGFSNLEDDRFSSSSTSLLCPMVGRCGHSFSRQNLEQWFISRQGQEAHQGETKLPCVLNCSRMVIRRETRVPQRVLLESFDPANLIANESLCQALEVIHQIQQDIQSGQVVVLEPDDAFTKCPKCQHAYSTQSQSQQKIPRAPIVSQCGHTHCLTCCYEAHAEAASNSRGKIKWFGCPTCHQARVLHSEQLYENIALRDALRYWNALKRCKFQQLPEQGDDNKPRVKQEDPCSRWRLRQPGSIGTIKEEQGDDSQTNAVKTEDAAMDDNTHSNVEAAIKSEDTDQAIAVKMEEGEMVEEEDDEEAEEEDRTEEATKDSEGGSDVATGMIKREDVENEIQPHPSPEQEMHSRQEAASQARSEEDLDDDNGRSTSELQTNTESQLVDNPHLDGPERENKKEGSVPPLDSKDTAEIDEEERRVDDDAIIDEAGRVDNGGEKDEGPSINTAERQLSTSQEAKPASISFDELQALSNTNKKRANEEDVLEILDSDDEDTATATTNEPKAKKENDIVELLDDSDEDEREVATKNDNNTAVTNVGVSFERYWKQAPSATKLVIRMLSRKRVELDPNGEATRDLKYRKLGRNDDLSLARPLTASHTLSTDDHLLNSKVTRNANLQFLCRDEYKIPMEWHVWDDQLQWVVQDIFVRRTLLSPERYNHMLKHSTSEFFEGLRFSQKNEWVVDTFDDKERVLDEAYVRATFRGEFLDKIKANAKPEYFYPIDEWCRVFPPPKAAKAGLTMEYSIPYAFPRSSQDCKLAYSFAAALHAYGLKAKAWDLLKEGSNWISDHTQISCLERVILRDFPNHRLEKRMIKFRDYKKFGHVIMVVRPELAKSHMTRLLVFYNGFMFEPSFPMALALTKDNLDSCCGDLGEFRDTKESWILVHQPSSPTKRQNDNEPPVQRQKHKHKPASASERNPEILVHQPFSPTKRQSDNEPPMQRKKHKHKPTSASERNPNQENIQGYADPRTQRHGNAYAYAYSGRSDRRFKAKKKGWARGQNRRQQKPDQSWS